MIPIFVDATTRNVITYASSPTITLNNPLDDDDDTYVVEDITAEPTWDAVVEPLPERDGLHAMKPRRMQLSIVIRGWVRATSHAALYDKIRALNRAFDPVLSYLDDTAEFDRGFVALDFNVPTADTANWPTGLIASRIYVSSTKRPVPLTTKFDGLAARFVIQLVAADPRVYHQTLTTTSRTSNGLISINTEKFRYPLYPLIQVTFTTAPSGTMTIQRTSPSDDATISLVHSKLAANKVLLIDTQAQTAEYDDGTDKIEAIAATTRYFQLLHNTTNNITVAGFPADAVISFIWRGAFD